MSIYITLQASLANLPAFKKREVILLLLFLRRGRFFRTYIVWIIYPTPCFDFSDSYFAFSSSASFSAFSRSALASSLSFRAFPSFSLVFFGGLRYSFRPYQHVLQQLWLYLSRVDFHASCYWGLSVANGLSKSCVLFLTQQNIFCPNPTFTLYLNTISI